ncbi:MAG: hypothetical protein K0Q47_902 [Sedimentibacter sp.]|nr:hypothetical protein [Sedimentibacter sp.]
MLTGAIMNPYLPHKKPRYVIVDYKADEEILNYFKKMDIEPIKTIKCPDLQEPVDGHPDMVIFPVDFQTFIVAPNVYSHYNTDQVLKYYLEEAGVEFIHVNQGYTKCSTALISETKALTSDVLIHEKLKSYNIDCMYIDPILCSLKQFIHTAGYIYEEASKRQIIDLGSLIPII